RYLISREEALERLQLKPHLASAEPIMLYIAGATWVIEYHTGPLILTARVKTVTTPRPTRAVLLPGYDVTVTDVKVDGVSLVEGTYVVDEEAGIVFSDLFSGDKVHIEYKVGANEIPPQARLACQELVAHTFQIARQGNGIGNESDTVQTPTGFLVPRRVWGYLQTMPGPAGIA
ncbi:MAG TPA: hypothetical protein VGK41_04865, partial [Solirubrobacterales bacterium]